MSTNTDMRRFSWKDLTEWTSLFNDVNGITNTDRAFDVELMRQYLMQPTCEPEENCFLAESHGSLIGCALISPELPIGRAVASGGVMESHRGDGIGRALLKAAIQHATALGASVLHIQASSDSSAARHLLESDGFRPVRKYSNLRWEGAKAPQPDLRGGFGLRFFRVGQDEGALTRLQNAAFGRSWGFCPNTVADIESRLAFKTCDPEGVIFVTNGDRLSAYAWTLRAKWPTSSTGWISMTGVHPDYRGLGHGRSVVLSGMEYLVSKGVRTIELEVDEQNIAAKEMYLSIGFRRVWETLWFERALEG